MRVLFVIENYLPHVGGVEVVFSQLAEGLVKEGHSVDVVTHHLKGTSKEETIKGVRVHRVGSNRYAFTFMALPLALRLAKDADIVHTTTFNGAPPAWIAAKARGKPVVITVHEVWLSFWDTLSDMSWLSRKLHWLLEKAIYLLPYDHYAAVSRFTAKDLQEAGIDTRKISAIHNAMDYSLFDPRKYAKKRSRKALKLPDEFLFFAYGRPGVSKGFEYLIEAAAIARKELPSSKLLLMLSDDPAYQQRKRLLLGKVMELGLGSFVHVMKPTSRDRLPLHVSAMDCVIVPSLREGFGYAALEPIAMGVPLIATKAGSLPEVVSGKHILVPPADPHSLADAMIAARRGKMGKTKHKKFLLSRNISSYLSLYRSLARARTRRA